MKLLVFVVLLPCFSFGQRVAETNKNEWNLSFGIMAYQPTKFNITPKDGYPSLTTNVSPDMNLIYRKRFAIDSTGYVFIGSGVGYISRISDVPVDTVAIRMEERFYDIPLTFGVAGKGANHFGYTFTAGLKFAALSKQEFYTQPSTAVSPFSNSGFGDYYKWGYGGDFAFNVYFHKNSIFSIGFYVNQDFSTHFSKKSSVDITTAYKAYGIYWAMGASF